MRRLRSRRSVLRAGALGLAAIAGCTANRTEESPESSTTTSHGTVPKATTTDPARTVTESETDPEPTTESEPAEETVGVDVRWIAPVGGQIPVPAVDEDTVYVTSSAGELMAFRTTDGRRRWRAKTGGRWYGPRVADATVYCPTGDTLHARATDDGGKRWAHEWEGNLTSMPTVDGDTVYVGNTDRATYHGEGSAYPEDLFALATSDGSVRWKRALANELGGAPVAADGRLYVQLGTSKVYALDPTDGTTIWQTSEVSVYGGAVGGLVVVDGTLVASAGNYLVGLDPSSGDVPWRFNTTATEIISNDGTAIAPVTDGQRVYAGHLEVTGTETTLYALDPTKGEEHWSKTIPGLVGSLSAHDGTLYVSATEAANEGGDTVFGGGPTTLYAFDASGDEQWRFKRTSGGFSQAVAADGDVYVGGRNDDGRLYALTPT